MWLGLNIARQRANYFGTFQLSVYYEASVRNPSIRLPL